MSLLTLEIQQDKDTTIIKIGGILDITTIEGLVSQIENMPEVSSLILDFSKLEFIDSTGIGAIMELIYLSEEKGFSIDLQKLNESIKQIFEMVGLFTIIKSLKKVGA